jgi:methyl-accepting chemotaxis protein/methyl-accepting chemotaxis protein-1 (serine sensor receptor)
MISNWSISKKLGICFGSMGLLMSGLGVSSWTTINTLGNGEKLAIVGLAKKVQLADTLDVSAEQMRSDARALVLSAYTKDSKHAQEARTAFEAAAEHFRTAMHGVTELIDGENERQIVVDLQKNLDGALPVFADIATLAANGQAEQAQTVYGARYAPVAAAADSITDRLRDEQLGDLKAADEEAARAVTLSRWINASLLFLALLTAMLALLMVRQVSSRLGEVARAISEHSERVAAAAGQVASASNRLAQGTSEQAASLEETSASTVEIDAVAQKNKGNSGAAAELVNDSNETIAKANQALEGMVHAMSEISASGGKISTIVKTIDGLAFQTNILALNAAVEAARAGEAGLGFAVVADEVRTLAGRCAEAAHSTAELIEESIARSAEGKNRLEEVAQAITRISDGSVRLRALIEDVNSSSHEQTRGIEQISNSIRQIETVTQQAAASSEESASASQALAGQAESMRNAAQQLTSIVVGSV